MPSCVLFRTHFSDAIGYGHLYRCLSLAEELKKQSIDVIFLFDFNVGPLHFPPALNEFNHYFLPDAGCIEHDEVNIIVNYLNSYDMKMVFYDKYGSYKETFSTLRYKGLLLAGFADFGVYDEYFDLQIDHNSSVEEARILGGFGACILNSQYNLSRSTRCNSNKLIEKDKLNLFVNMGSGDVDLYKTIIISAFKMMDVNNMFNVYWLDNSGELSVGQDVVKINNIKVIKNIENMADFLGDMDLAVGSCGVNAFERCSMGIFSLVVKTVENQRRNYNSLLSHKLAIGFDDSVALKDKLYSLFINRKELRMHSIRCFQAIDGMGSERVAKHINKKFFSAIAISSDCHR